MGTNFFKMDSIDFVSSKLSSRSREEIKERREYVLAKAERKAKKAQAEKDKASGWMLPEIEDRLFSSSKSSKKSHKEKKHKKEKKSKKKRKKYESSSSSSESEDEWVEKSHKHKKHKKEKKSKKKRKRHDSSSDSSSDSKNEDFTEKESNKSKPKIERDSW